jgi:hypothetical protein
MSDKRKKAAKAAKIHKDSMPCNKPRKDVQGGKKSVVKACEGGKEKIVRFGDANMEIKRDNPERRKNFRARHNCDQKEKGSKLTAGYWSCRAWVMLPLVPAIGLAWNALNAGVGGTF